MICLVAGPGAAPVGALAVPAALGAEPEHKYDGVYTGKRSLTKGTASTTCPAEDDVSVTIHGEMLTFTNSALKNFTEPFDPGQDGSFGETYTDAGGAVVHYHGRIIGDVIEADVSNPPCEHHWYLKKEGA
jgi:hypothetical protein